MTKKYIILILILQFSIGNSLYAQKSIIDQMIKKQKAIVGISSHNKELFKSKPQDPVLNPETGRLIVLRNLTQASYTRDGAGVIIHPSGIIVTNAHTINRANHIIITMHDGSQIAAQVLQVIGNLDLAYLKIDAPYPLPVVRIADSDKVKLHDEIITVGHSEFLNKTVSGGRIKGLGTSRTKNRSGEQRNDLLQTSINVYSGDSGGPLFNKDGDLIGLMTAKELGSIRSSFAVPSNKIAHYLKKFLLNTNLKP